MFNAVVNRPDERGRFGRFGGKFVPEVLIPALAELEGAYTAARVDDDFKQAYVTLLKEVVGRPSPLYLAKRLGKKYGATILLKREDLNHTGAHKINNTLGQALLCERMGKKRIIAETGAGQHGVATATACALFGFECIVFMGEEDVRRQSLNVERMKLMGAELRPVSGGTKTLKDAMNEAMRHWVSNIDSTYYMVGSAAGPHPYPEMVRDLQAVIGEECRSQVLSRLGRLPDAVVACVGGGSNAIGLFHPFIEDKNVELYGAEAAGKGLHTTEHSASMNCGKEGVFQGAFTKILQSDDGQILPPHSVAAGLDYPAVGPEHAWLQDIGRAEYLGITDSEALEALTILSRTEGIIPALESAHAVALGLQLAKKRPGSTLVIGLSGRGDKDMHQISEHLEAGSFEMIEKKS